MLHRPLEKEEQTRAQMPSCIKHGRNPACHCRSYRHTSPPYEWQQARERKRSGYCSQAGHLHSTVCSDRDRRGPCTLVLQQPEAIHLQRLEAWKRCPVGGPFDPRCIGARDADVQHLVLQGHHHPGCCDPCLMRTKIPRATIDDCRPPSKRIGLYHISFLSSLVSFARKRLRLPARCPHVCMADTSRNRPLTLDNKDWLQPPTPIATAAAAAAKCHSFMKGAEG